MKRKRPLEAKTEGRSAFSFGIEEVMDMDVRLMEKINIVMGGLGKSQQEQG